MTYHYEVLEMKLTKLSYYLIYLSYVLETYLCIAMGNPTSIQQLILTILWGVSIIIHFTLTVYFEKLYIINTIYLLSVCVWCLLNDPVNHLLQTIATGVVGLLLSIFGIIYVWHNFRETDKWKNFKKLFVTTNE